MRLSERVWFRWALAAVFVAAMFSLPWALGHPPQEQTQYEPAHRADNVVAPITPDERVADYTEALAVFTAMLAVFTVVLAGASIWQGWLTQKSIGLAREEYLSTHRPTLDIRLIKLEDVEIGKSVHIKWFIANVGGSDAKIVGSNATVAFLEIPLPAEANYSALEQSMGNPDLPPGVGVTKSIRFHIPPKDWGGFRLWGVSTRPNNLYFFGYILYEDRKRTKRSMAFCRYYDPSTERFVAVDDPNYEHSA